MIDSGGVGVIASSLVKVIQAEKLVERCAGEIHGREVAVNVQEAVSGSGGIDIEPVGIAPVVDPNDLRLRGIGKILGSKIVWQGQDKPLVNCGAMITGDHFKIVDAEQLGERVAREIDCSEVKAAFPS